MGNEKTQIKVVVIGHPGSGRKTITGQMLHKLGGIDQRSIERFEKKEAAELGESAKYNRLVLEKIKAEMGNELVCETSKCKVTIVDTFGLSDSFENIITNASPIDCAIVIMSAATGEFEAGFSKQGDARKHIQLALKLGVKHVIVTINKMDTVHWWKNRFDEVDHATHNYIKKCGYNGYYAPGIPTSALIGDNIIGQSKNMSWFKGPALLEVIDNIYAAS